MTVDAGLQNGGDNLQGGDGGGGGAQGGDWKGALPEDVRDHPSMKDIASVENLAKSYVHQQKLVGKDKLPLPTSDDDPIWDEVYTRLGRPDTPDKYEIAMPEDYPKEMVDEEFLGSFRQWVHKAGLSPRQVKSLANDYLEYQAGYLTKQNATIEEQTRGAETALRKDWGRAYDSKVSLAQKTLQTFADKDAIELMDMGLGNHPAIVKMFAKIGEQMGEDTLAGRGRGFTMTPTEAQAEITSIMSNMKDAYWDNKSPVHKERVEYVARLHEMAYPEEPKE